MNDVTPTSAERAEKLQGMGCKRKRVEDILLRSVRKGNLRRRPEVCRACCTATSRGRRTRMRASRSIDTARRRPPLPGVVAVITAETLKTVNLAWMPTLAGDVQMVLADGKVLFQNQEVAFVIVGRAAMWRPTRADLVEVEYEALPPCNVDPIQGDERRRAG